MPAAAPELHGYDPNGVYAVGVVLADTAVPLNRAGLMKRERIAGKLKRAMEASDMPPICALMQNQIVFLLPESVRAEQVWRMINAPDLALAVSLPHRRFENVYRGYKEIMMIVPHMAAGHFRSYEDLLVLRVLTGDREARSAFTGQLFAPLRRAKSGNTLIRTLLLFAHTGFHLKNTAEKLKIHPKTLRYRLDRAIALGGFDLHHADTQFKLQLACRIMRMEEPRAWDGDADLLLSGQANPRERRT